MESRYVGCEFCVGAGGGSEGLEQAGINIAFANEINNHAALTYQFNHPGTVLLKKDMKEVKSREVFDASGTNIFVVAAGLPCQGFSTAGRRDIRDPRNRMFRNFLRIAGRLGPKVILIENVPGLLSFNKGRTIEAIERAMEDLGYFTSKNVLNAGDFGTPQNRKRLIIIGSLRRHVDINSLEVGETKKITVKEAISDLDFLDAGELSYYYAKDPESDYQKAMREGSKILFNHEAPKHSKKVVRRFSMLKSGQSMRDIPEWARTKKLVLYRLEGTERARTVTTLPDDYVHYSRNRILSVRELARLQGVRDSYLFMGPKSTGGKKRKKDCCQYTQVGNMLPPPLAKAIGEWLIRTV